MRNTFRNVHGRRGWAGSESAEYWKRTKVLVRKCRSNVWDQSLFLLRWRSRSPVWYSRILAGSKENTSRGKVSSRWGEGAEDETLGVGRAGVSSRLFVDMKEGPVLFLGQCLLQWIFLIVVCECVWPRMAVSYLEILRHWWNTCHFYNFSPTAVGFQWIWLHQVRAASVCLFTTLWSSLVQFVLTLQQKAALSLKVDKIKWCQRVEGPSSRGVCLLPTQCCMFSYILQTREVIKNFNFSGEKHVLFRAVTIIDIGYWSAFIQKANTGLRRI